MAALSSECGRSTTKTVHVTYQELVELAEALEKDKRERTYKAKSEEVEGACSTDVSPCENVSPSKETNSPISKSEKKTLEDRKSSSRKDSDKKKHKERKRDKKDEKSLKNKAENEAFEVQNKEFVEANFTAELGDDEDNAKQTAKDKKKLRKRSPKSKEKSIEETANIEESVEKLKLHDNDQESKSKHKERTKKHSDSKKKERKKYKQNNDECPDEESKVINHKQDFINNEDEQLNSDHHHGILKSPNSKSNHYHSHVSFSEETDSHIIDYNTGKERGILRIPQGVNIHDGEVIESQQYTDKDIEAEYSRNDDVSNSISNQTPVQSSHSQSDVSKSKSCEQEDLKLNSAEKRLRSLNRQRAQQLVKQAHHAENTLSNLLSKGVTEQGTLKKVFLLSKEIQDLYQGVIMLDLSFTQQHDIDQRLWKNAFYQVIETFRKYGKLFLGYSSQKDTISPEKINAELGDFLQAAGNFYSGLLNGLQKTYHFDVQVIVSQPRKAEFLARSAKLALLSCHHTLIFLGDIERYKNQLKPYSTSNWSGIRSWYLKASKLAPKNGKPYNQLAVIAVYANRKLDAVFYYVRSLCVNSPILTAKEKLTTIFYEIQKKADQLHWEEVQERKRQHEMKVQRERSAGRGRNVFREVAKGVGLVGGTNSGRHEIWVFIRQGKYRRLVLTEHGAVQQVDAMGKPISRDVQEEPEPKKETKQESPKISLQEVNKKFMLHFLCAHGLLYTRIGMERLPALQVQLIGELHTLLRYPQCSSVGYYPLLQMAAINMFAIDHTALQEETKEPFVRLGTPQDQALNLSMEVLVTVLNACTELLSGGDHGNMLSDTLRQYVPTIKVWFDWLICHQDLWQISNISIHRTLWEAVSQFTNAILQLQLPCFEEDENEEVLVTLTEDEFLAGFKPLINAEHSVLNIKISQNKELVQDHLHIAAFKKFAMQMSSMSNPTMQYCEETRQFSAVIPSLPTSPEQTDSSVAVHMDVEHQNNQECYESDEVIIEGVLEDIDSGDEADKGFKELKAKKDQLARELEDHEEKHSKARAVVHENISRAHLMFENYPNYLVPDTNCFIDQISGLQAIVMSNDFTLIVPIVVINELDGLKKDFLVDKYHDYNHAQMVMNNARAAIDFLEDQFSRRSPYVKALTSKGTVMDTIAFRSEDTSSRKGNNDDVILSCCLHYCEENFVNRLATADQPITIRRNVVLLTDDRNLRVKAYTRNVPVLTVPQFRQMARL